MYLPASAQGQVSRSSALLWPVRRQAQLLPRQRRQLARCSSSFSGPNAAAAAPGEYYHDDENAMAAALRQARLAALLGEVPVGAVLLDGAGQLIAAAHNETLARNSPLAHAEMICLEAAAQRLGAWRLLDATLFVTCEPCPMCAGAVYQARVKRLVYGTRQPRIGADGSWISMFPGSAPPGAGGVDVDAHGGGAAGMVSGPKQGLIKPHPFHPSIQVTRGVLREECAGVLRAFFKERRQAAASRGGLAGGSPGSSSSEEGFGDPGGPLA